MMLTRAEAEALLTVAQRGWFALEEDGHPPAPSEAKPIRRALKKLKEEVQVLQERDKLSEAQLELRVALHRLWLEAGEPSVRQMSRDMGMAHMTWHYALKCDPVPALSTFRKLVTYLDGDLGRMEELWFRAKGKAPIS